ADEGSFLSDAPLSALQYRNIPLINRLRLEYDALTYRWQSRVVGFNSEEQFDLLTRWMGQVTAAKFAAVLIGSWVLVLVPVAIALFRRREVRVLRAEDKAYRRFCDRLAKAGLPRQAGETPEAYGLRAAEALPALADSVMAVTRMYTQLAYAPAGGDAALVKEFESLVAKARPSLREAR
ncbi:MAG: DUF4129 domain-containing protein, partial [Halioglobus sp.]